MNNSEYSKLLTENITHKYKLAKDDTVKKIDKEFISIAENLNISDRIDQTAQKEAFITLKDHKENFETNQKCRLINPTKSDIGKVSKIMLDRINTKIRTISNVNQWCNTYAVIDWFSSLNEKRNLTFLVFDIVEFYPSISENLLTDALEWAKKFTSISDLEKSTIMHARKTLLFDEFGRPWIKRDSDNAFDVAMGAYDGAEICELVGLFILHDLEKNLGAESVGLYRDDGLAVLRKCSGSDADRMRKKIAVIFKSYGLRITVETNLKSVNFLDVNLNLNTGSYKPYRKPNNPPVYINTSSNHPPAIIKNIPAAIGKRVSLLSSNEDIFDQAAGAYNDALKSSGYSETIQYSEKKKEESIPTNQNSINKSRSKNRKRKIIWFNPPYSKNVKTNVGATFIRLINKHFPKGSNYIRSLT
jgi:hypothetical protein